MAGALLAVTVLGCGADTEHPAVDHRSRPAALPWVDELPAMIAAKTGAFWNTYLGDVVRCSERGRRGTGIVYRCLQRHEYNDTSRGSRTFTEDWLDNHGSISLIVDDHRRPPADAASAARRVLAHYTGSMRARRVACEDASGHRNPDGPRGSRFGSHTFVCRTSGPGFGDGDVIQWTAQGTVLQDRPRGGL